MQAPCPACRESVDLFPSWIVARNAYPGRKPEIQILCPTCGDIFPGLHGRDSNLPHLPHRIQPGARSTPQVPRRLARHCQHRFSILDAIVATKSRPTSGFTASSCLPATGQGIFAGDRRRPGAHTRSAATQRQDVAARRVISDFRRLPRTGYNTRQAMSYGFTAWRDFFNDRQLLALGWLHAAISHIADAPALGPPC